MNRWLVIGWVLIPWLATQADDWPQWQGPQRDGIWRESQIVREFDAGGPPVSWRAKVAGGYAGPAVAQGRVFLTDYVVASGDTSPSSNARSEVKGTERVLCLNEQTGKLLWKHDYPRRYGISYPAGPRATPTVDGDRVYILGAEGDLLCLRVNDGEVIWSRNLSEAYQAETPFWGHAAHPLVVGDLLYCLVGGSESAVVAFDKHSGRERWQALSTPSTGVGYAPPTLIHAGGTDQLLIWHSAALNSLDPASGKLYWTHPLEPDYGMSIAPPQRAGNLLFVGALKNKSMGLRLAAREPAAEVLWRGDTKTGIGPSHCPLAVDPHSDDYLYGVDRSGALLGIELKTGKQLWSTFQLMANKRFSNSGTAFLTRNDDVFFILSETAELIIAKLSPQGYEEISRSPPLLEPTHVAMGRSVLWSPPAYANGAMFVRNDKELIRVSLRQAP